ncbi:MAG: hypothetical protein JO061_07415 [Acidobacteriaceae bacterium]|nr:hypothetical protein [Acidobacteriaceae bacterium]
MRHGRFLVVAVAFAAMPLRSDPVGGAPPSAEEQAAIVDSMKRYAQQYVSTLPNFLCMQVTEQYKSDKKAEHWKKGETLTSRLAYVDGREKRTLELVNDKPVRTRTSGWRMPLTTEGEFGELLDRVFADDSQAAFTWNRWDTLGTKHVAVFDFSIEKEHSTLKLTAGDLATAIIAYHGSVNADPKTGAIWRVSDDAVDLPPELRTYEIGTTVEYESIAIGGNSYVLPVHASVLCRTFDGSMRNEIYFRNYRKFEAESTLKYETPGDDPQAR